MNWGLTQGLMGRARASLAPSMTAVGPNTYLTRTDFFKMLGIALLFHLLFFLAASFFPGEKVTHIPVRALSFKLGDQDRVAAYGSPTAPSTAAPVIHPPVMGARTGEDTSRVLPDIPPIQFKPAPVPARVRAPVPVHPTPHPSAVRAPEAPPAPTTPAIAPTPQQYVREVGQPAPAPASAPEPAPAAAIPTTVVAGTATGSAGGAGAVSTQTEQTAQAIRERYEQQISSWIERHKFYPAAAGGRDGRVIVRIRIDRAGVIRYYALEQTSGIAAIDTAAIDMIRRANPVPSVPENYPAGSLIEFLIPITFAHPNE